MPIAGGILVAGSASRCLSSAAGMLRFLARLSGRRRHVRRSCVGPGGASCCGIVKATGDTGVECPISACVTPEVGSIGGDMERRTATGTTTTTTTMTRTSTRTTMTTMRTRTTSSSSSASSLVSRLDGDEDTRNETARCNETIERIESREDDSRTRETIAVVPNCTSCRENDRLSTSTKSEPVDPLRLDPLRVDDIHNGVAHRGTRKFESNSQVSTTLVGTTQHPEAMDDVEEFTARRQQRPKNSRRSQKRDSDAAAPSRDVDVSAVDDDATTTTTFSFTTTTTTITTTRTRTRTTMNTRTRSRNDDDVDGAIERGTRAGGIFSHTGPETINRDRRRDRTTMRDAAALGRKERGETGDYERKRDSDNSSFSNTSYTRRPAFPPYLATLLIISYTLFGIADACSSRSTPKPRPPTPTPRPNITFHMYTCPPDYAEWYCLNGATCFTVKIQESLLYNCLCANGFIGQRCEFKDLDGSYLPSRQRVMLETASIAGGATIAVFLVVIICIAAYIHCKRKQKELRTSSTCVDTVDGPGRDPELRPFSNRSRSLMIFMAKNPNGSTMSPSIEQTRMPGWSDYSQTETARMASVNEEKRGSSQ